MIGMDAATGKQLSGGDHLRQSVTNILTTPLTRRLMVRDFGSRLFDLIDRPLNNETTVEIIAATAEALSNWEPRINLKRVVVSRPEAGHMNISIEYTNTETGDPGLLEGIRL